MEESKQQLDDKHKDIIDDSAQNLRRKKRGAFFETFIRLYKKIFYEIRTEATTRSNFCKHKIASCYMHALEGFIKNFLYGATVKAGVFLAFSMLSPKKKLINGLKQCFSFDTLLFGVVTGGFLGAFRFMLCKLKQLRNKDDKYNSIIAGFLSSLVLIIDRSKARRITIACYAFARCFESMIKIMDSNDIAKERPFWPILLMSVLHVYIAYTWYWEADVFPPGLEKALLVISGPKPNDWNIMDKITRKKAFLDGISPYITSRYGNKWH